MRYDAGEGRMADLTFSGRDFRDLLDVLISAVDLAGREPRPSIIVNGMIYAPGDLMKVAGLLPDLKLSAKHQAAVSRLLQKPPRGYRRAGASLARHATSIAADAAEARERRSRGGKQAAIPR
jgi:hypothetical protein